MATLNLSKMKYMSETNLKKFANLIISLSSQVTDVENKCIKPYVDGELYPRDSYVSYNGYIYQATATNQDSAFDETHWDKLSDDFNELTVADIEAMLGLSQEQLETMANLIADTEVRLDKTYSSSKIYQDIQQCLNDSKSYTLKEIAKLNGSSYKVVTSTSEMTSESIIYLLASGNTYDMYIVEENGATTKFGDMDVNLDNYFTKTEIEADYLKKADADGKFATINGLSNHVSDTVSHMTQTEKDKIITTDDVDISKLVIKDDIVKMNKENIIVYIPDGFTTLSSYIDTLTDDRIYFIRCTLDDAPGHNGEQVQCMYMVIKHATIFTRVVAYSMTGNQTWERWHFGGQWTSEWKMLCTTSVADKSKTLITFPDETNHKIATATETYYIVKNGICFVHLVFITVTADTITQVQNLPIPLANAAIYGQVTQYDYKNITSVGARVALFDTGTLGITGGNVGTIYTCCFSYPVAE